MDGLLYDHVSSGPSHLLLLEMDSAVKIQSMN